MIKLFSRQKFLSGQQTNCDVIGIWPNATYECWLPFFVLLLCCEMSQLLGDLNSVSYWIFFLQKREKRMLANWKLLTRSLLIRERLKKRYDTEVLARPKLHSQESSFVIVCDSSPFIILTRGNMALVLHALLECSRISGEEHVSKSYSKHPLIRNWIKNLLAETCHFNTPKYKNLFSQARSSRFLYVGHS